MTPLRFILGLGVAALIGVGCGGNQAAPSADATPTQAAGATLLSNLPTTTPASGGLQQAYFGVLPSATSPACPSAYEWPLLYWRGPETPIAQVTAACTSVDFYWARRATEWMGYAVGVPAFATDDFRVAQGEALFIHGKAQ